MRTRLHPRIQLPNMPHCVLPHADAAKIANLGDVNRRQVQRTVAVSFLFGVAVMVVGLILCLTVSFGVGLTVLPLGALISGVARLASRRFKLDAA